MHGAHHIGSGHGAATRQLLPHLQRTAVHLQCLVQVAHGKVAAPQFAERVGQVRMLATLMDSLEHGCGFLLELDGGAEHSQTAVNERQVR